MIPVVAVCGLPIQNARAGDVQFKVREAGTWFSDDIFDRDFALQRRRRNAAKSIFRIGIES